MKYILTYGIACVETKSGETELITSVPDVTINRHEAEHLIDLLNKCRLSPEHIADVVDDLLCKI